MNRRAFFKLLATAAPAAPADPHADQTHHDV